MSNNSQPTNEPSILGQFASVVGLLGASLYFTGWIYRWQYYKFFTLEVITLDLPVESFLLVPIQVLFGNIWATGKTLIAMLLTALCIHVTLWFLQTNGNWIVKRINSWQQKLTTIPYHSKLIINRQKQNREYYKQKQYVKSKIWQSFIKFSSLKIRSIQFLRSLFNESIIVIWVLIALFLLARSQGFSDARRDAINQTSTLPMITLVIPKDTLAISLSPSDPSTQPSLQEFRFLGDQTILRKLQPQVYNDYERSRVWRLLIQRNGWIYVFQTLSKKAPLNRRPLVLAIKEGDAGNQFMIRSPDSPIR